MIKETFYVTSSFDGLQLSCAAYLPDDTESEIKGTVQLVHGMCEYKERYEPFAEFLTENGFVVIAHDHRGHGNSVKSEADLGYFGDKKGVAIVDDTALVTDEAKRRYPDLPLTLFGHSMGSLVVRAYLKKYEEKIDKLVVCGSPSKNPLAGIGLLLNGIITLFKGSRHRSATMAKATTGGGDDEFPNEGKNAWLTCDSEVTERYNADLKCNFTFTCNGFSNLLRLLKATYKKGNYPVKKADLPIMFIAGGDDPVIHSAEKWEKARDFMRKAGYKNVRGKLYEGMRHEVLNEIGKEEVFDDILRFIEEN